MQSDYMTKAISGSEDCLYLNVYAPKTANKNKPLPVLVFIHGGSYRTGSADPAVFGPDYFMDTQEVVVVVIQYRLGVFGFLASGDRNCKGNFGLKDQQMALYWVRKNIRAFGGDSHRITIMGQSAGASFVQYHMVSSRSNGLFHKAIMSSGSVYAFWAIHKDPEALFRQYAAIAKIPLAGSVDTEEIVDVLRRTPAADLIKFQDEIYIYHAMLGNFLPVIEGDWRGAFVQEDPKYLWESCSYEQRPFLIGVNGYDQGAWDDLYQNVTLREAFLASPEYNILTVADVPLTASGPIIDYYLDGQPTAENAEKYIQYLVDTAMRYPLYRTVRDYTQCGNVKKRPVDLYLFNFTSSFSLSGVTNPFPIDLTRGASHVDDLLYLFRFKSLDPVFKRGAAENDMKDYYVRYMVNYMKQGVKYSEKLRRCSIEYMDEGFCDYLSIQREDDEVAVSVSNHFDLEMVKVLKQVDESASQLDE